TMKAFLAAAMVAALAGQSSSAQPQLPPRSPGSLRFTVPPELLVISNGLAQPGGVPLSLSPTNVNVEIVEWAAAPSTNKEPGEFTLRLAGPVPVGTDIVDGAQAVHCEAAGRGEKRDPAQEAGRKLQFLALPPGVPVEAIKFT